MTLREAMQKISADEELKSQFMSAVQSGKAETVKFLDSLGCKVTEEELMAALGELTPSKEITDEELQFISGGSKEGAKVFFEGVGQFLLGFLEGTHG